MVKDNKKLLVAVVNSNNKQKFEHITFPTVSVCNKCANYISNQILTSLKTLNQVLNLQNQLFRELFKHWDSEVISANT